MAYCTECGEALPAGAKFCAACGAAVPKPAAKRTRKAVPPPEPEPVVEPEPEPQPEPERRTFVERVLEADWRAALFAAGPAVLVTFVAAQVAGFWTVLGSRGDSLSSYRGFATWLHQAAAFVAMAYRSPAFDRYGESLVPPLTITLLGLGALWYGLRRTRPSDATAGDVLTHAIRGVALFVAGLTVVAAFGGSGSRGFRQTTSPGRVFFWSLLFGSVVAATVVVPYRPRASERVDRALADWALPWRAGLAGLATGVGLSGLTSVVLLFALHLDMGYGDRARSLPLVFAYLVNAGTWLFSVASGGLFDTVGAHYSLFDRHALSAWYFLLLLLPVVAVGTGAAYVVRHRGDRTDRATLRACYRMAASAGLGWWLLALLSRVHFDVSAVTGATTRSSVWAVGPSVLLDLLVIVAWFLVGGFVAGRVALRVVRPVAEAEPLARQPLPRRTGYAVLVALLALVVALAVTAALVGKTPRAGGLPYVSTDWHSTTTDSGARVVLQEAAIAESAYFTDNRTYTSNECDLELYGVTVPDDITLVIFGTDSTGFCMEASDGTGAYTYKSGGGLSDGANCPAGV